MVDDKLFQRESSLSEANLGRRYYFSMLSLPLLVLLLTTLSAFISGHFHHLGDHVLGIVVILVVTNMIGARIIFGPIAQYLAGRAEIQSARRRLLKLSRVSALWAVILVFTFMCLQFFFHHVWHIRSASNLLEMLVYPATLIAVFAVFMALIVYFLVTDFTARFREELYFRYRIVIDPGTGRIWHKLIVAFFAVSVVPMALLFYRLHFYENMPHLQGLNVESIVQIDILGAILLTGIAIVFISRNLTRPVNSLLLSMNRLSSGDMSSRTPVISDDEIGSLSLGFNSMAEKLEEQGFIRETFGKFVPEGIATTVLQDRGIIRPQLREATILFTDIEGFTAICEKLSPAKVIEMLNEYFAAIAEPIRQAGGVITQFQGDAVLVSFNLPVEDPHHAASAVRAALGIQRITQTRRFVDGIVLKTRIGINTGTIVGGTVGDGDHLGYTVHGDAVNLAARLEQMNKEYGSYILMSQRTSELAGNGFNFKEVGKTTIRGREKPLLVYEVLNLPKIK